MTTALSPGRSYYSLLHNMGQKSFAGPVENVPIVFPSNTRSMDPLVGVHKGLLTVKTRTLNDTISFAFPEEEKSAPIPYMVVGVPSAE